MLTTTYADSGAEGVGVATAVVNEERSLPLDGHSNLHGAYPNPFSTETTITFTLKSPAPVKLEWFDLLRRRVATLIDGRRPPACIRPLFAAAWAPAVRISTD